MGRVAVLVQQETDRQKDWANLLSAVSVPSAEKASPQRAEKTGAAFAELASLPSNDKAWPQAQGAEVQKVELAADRVQTDSVGSAPPEAETAVQTSAQKV